METKEEKEKQCTIFGEHKSVVNIMNELGYYVGLENFE